MKVSVTEVITYCCMDGVGYRNIDIHIRESLCYRNHSPLDLLPALA